MQNSAPSIRRYWDSTCFLSILNNEPSASDCQRILELAAENKTVVCVSPLVPIEVVRPRRSTHPLPSHFREAVRDLFRGDVLHWRDIDRDIATVSQVISWDFRIHPRDAVHLAVALDYGCDRFETLDDKLLNKSGRLPTDAIRDLLTGDRDRSPLEITVPREPAPGNLFRSDEEKV